MTSPRPRDPSPGEVPAPDATTVRVGGDEAVTERGPDPAWTALAGTKFVQGAQIAHYRLLEVAGFGGMGQVWKAFDAELERVVALKFLTASSPEAVARFRQEAHLAAALRHPNIAPVHAFIDGQPPAIAMEFVDGVPLCDWQGDRLALLARAAEALDYAHGQGILHRDLKPSNLLVDAAGRIFVVDFGLARRISSDDALTRTGAVLGTPGYMAPEQAMGAREVDARTDVYGLGATLYALLAGRPPHTGPNTYAILRGVLEDDPVPPGGPRDLQTIALKALAKDPARRYGSAREFAQDLRRALAHEPILARHATAWERLRKRIRRRPVVWSLVLALGLVLLASAGLLFGQWLEQRRLIVELEARGASLRSQSETLAERNRRLELQAFYDRCGRQLSEARDRLARRLSDGRLSQVVAELRTLEESLAMRMQSDPAEPALPFLRAELRALRHDRAGATADFSAALALPATSWSRALDIAPRAALGRARVRLRGYFAEFFDQSTRSGEERLERVRGELAALVSEDLEAAAAVPVTLEEQLQVWRALVAGDTAWIAQAQARLAQGGNHPEVLFVLGLYEHLHGDEAAAAERYSQSLRLDHNQPDCLHARGLCAWGDSRGRAGADELRQVIADNRAALRLDPTMEMAHYMLAIAVGELDGMVPAIAALDRGIELLPGAVRLLRLRALASKRLGHFEAALADLERAHQAAPTDPAVLEERAKLHSGQGQWEAALADYSAALQLDPERGDCRHNRVICWLVLGRPAEALPDAAWLLARAPEDPVVVNLVGAVRAEAGEPESALQAFDALLAQRADPSVLENSARVLAQLGRDEEAVARLQQALVLEPGDLDALELLVEVLSRLGRLDEADSVLSQSLAVTPERPGLLRQRAHVRRLLGDRVGAREDLRQALRLLEPASEEAAALRSELEELEGAEPQP